jgi:hypothetical protein
VPKEMQPDRPFVYRALITYPGRKFAKGPYLRESDARRAVKYYAAATDIRIQRAPLDWEDVE